MDDDQNHSFQYVTRAPKTSRKTRLRKNKAPLATDPADVLQRRIEIINARKDELRRQAAVQHFLAVSFPAKHVCEETTNLLPTTVLGLGLGSIKDSRAAQTQLAFLLILCDYLAEQTQLPLTIQSYDPVYDESDHTILSAFNVIPIRINLQGRHVVQTSMLLFMPHCPRELYENFLRTNWNRNALGNVLLCCNELDKYVGGMARKYNVPCLERIGE